MLFVAAIMAIVATASLITASLFLIAYKQSKMQTAGSSQSSFRVEESAPLDQQDQFKGANFYRNFMGRTLNISVVVSSINATALNLPNTGCLSFMFVLRMQSPSPEKYDTDVTIGPGGELVLLRFFKYDFLMALEYSLNFT